jgi:hypothetical protein
MVTLWVLALRNKSGSDGLMSITSMALRVRWMLTPRRPYFGSFVITIKPKGNPDFNQAQIVIQIMFFQ